MSEISMELIKKLREKTGIGMMDCKSALQEANGDIDKAIELLRKKGAAIAQKRAGNATSEGLIHAYIHPGSRIGVMLELNCETDFVARTDEMKSFANDVAMHIAAFRPLCVTKQDADPALIAHETNIYKEQVKIDPKFANKPANIVEGIVQGKLDKFYNEICLMSQPFVKNDKLTVDDVLKDLIAKLGESIKIKKFIRFEIGA